MPLTDLRRKACAMCSVEKRQHHLRESETDARTEPESDTFPAPPTRRSTANDLVDKIAAKTAESPFVSAVENQKKYLFGDFNERTQERHKRVLELRASWANAERLEPRTRSGVKNVKSTFFWENAEKMALERNKSEAVWTGAVQSGVASIVAAAN